jgi:hypothetical protein
MTSWVCDIKSHNTHSPLTLHLERAISLPRLALFWLSFRVAKTATRHWIQWQRYLVLCIYYLQIVCRTINSMTKYKCCYNISRLVSLSFADLPMTVCWSCWSRWSRWSQELIFADLLWSLPVFASTLTNSQSTTSASQVLVLNPLIFADLHWSSLISVCLYIHSLQSTTSASLVLVLISLIFVDLC